MARHYESKKHHSKHGRMSQGSDDGGAIVDKRAHSIAEKDMRHEFYAGMDGRRRQEMQDAEMIYEDHNAIANLPQQVMMKPYPMTGPYMPEELDDNISGIDRQIDHDDSQRRRGFMPKKV